MIDLTKKALPNTITVDGRAYSIYTDFRVWMQFEISLRERRGDLIPVSYLFKNEAPSRCDVRDLLAFARPEHVLPRPVRGTSSDVILLDFKIDSDLIYAAFLQQYGVDLIDVPELHWHKFLAMLNGLRGTKLDEVMGYRCYQRQTDKDIDPYEEMREAWAIERPLSEEEEAELEAFNAAFS